ncbi:MAG: hypothetical protein JST16_01935 [Bdellovibrionales bacterium]|nr:hypothetical protein [Bdellovibrionales bacterium]
MFYKSSDAARLLGVGQALIRNLCQLGLIECQLTAGGHYRISEAEVQRLKTEGLPPVPHPMPANSRTIQTAAPTAPAANLDRLPDVAQAQADVIITEQRLKQRRLEVELAEVEDRLSAREATSARERAEAEARQAAKVAAERAQRERQEWMESWLVFAMESVSHVGPETELTVHRNVLTRLNALDTIPSRDVTRRIVTAEINKVLAEADRQRQIEQLFENVPRRILPLEAKSYPPTAWQVDALRDSRKAVAALHPDATLAEIEAAITEAAQRVAARFEAGQAKEEDDEMRRRIVRWERTSLDPLLNEAQREQLDLRLAEALVSLPQGTPKGKVESACKAAAMPFRQIIEEAREQKEKREKAEIAFTIFHAGKVQNLLDQYEKGGILHFSSWYHRNETRNRCLVAAKTAILPKLMANVNADVEKDLLLAVEEFTHPLRQY